LCGEVFEGVAQLGVAASSECVSDPVFCGLGLAVDGLLEAASFGGESNYAGASVVGVGFSGEVAVGFEVAEEVIDRLFCDLELFGEFGGALPVEAGMTKQSDVGRVHVVVAGGADAREDVSPHLLPDVAQHRANERAFVFA
jgi:hypothetical protein